MKNSFNFFSLKTFTLLLIFICLISSFLFLFKNLSYSNNKPERTAPYFATFLSEDTPSNTLLVGGTDDYILIKRSDKIDVYQYDLKTGDFKSVQAENWKNNTLTTECKKQDSQSSVFATSEYKAQNDEEQIGFPFRLQYTNGKLIIKNKVVLMRGEYFDKSLYSPSKQKVAILSYDGPLTDVPGFIFGGKTLIKGKRYIQVFSDDEIKELIPPTIIKVDKEDSLPALCWSPDEKVLVAYEYNTRYISFVY